jgi:hypothetical protein
MATREINTSGATGIDQATINTLKSVMVQGAVIYAVHVNSLITLWNNFIGHSHTISDLYGIKEFGNTNPSGYAGSPGSSESDTTGAPVGLNGAIGGVSQGQAISHSKYNELRNAVAGQLAHYHTWDDRAS